MVLEQGKQTYTRGGVKSSRIFSQSDLMIPNPVSVDGYSRATKQLKLDFQNVVSAHNTPMAVDEREEPRIDTENPTLY